MTETIKKNDFVEVEYTGKVKEGNVVFDTTSEKIARENKISNQQAQYRPNIVCIGQHQLLTGLDETMPGKEVGKEYTIEIPPEKGFGKKSAQLLKLIPLKSFKDPRQLAPGIQVDVDGNYGSIKTISGGRVLVDFNHPLASKELVYTIKAIKIVTDDVEKIKSILSLTLNLRKDFIDVDIVAGKATVATMKMPEIIQKEFAKKITELVPTVKEVVFKEKTHEKKV